MGRKRRRLRSPLNRSAVTIGSVAPSRRSRRRRQRGHRAARTARPAPPARAWPPVPRPCSACGARAPPVAGSMKYCSVSSVILPARWRARSCRRRSGRRGGRSRRRSELTLVRPAPDARLRARAGDGEGGLEHAVEHGADGLGSWASS